MIATTFFDPQPDRTQVWSSGGGTQSCAIAALICEGILPKPDIALMVNTERENSDTFQYLQKWTAPALEKVGVIIHIIDKSKFATVDLYSKNGKSLLLPIYTNVNEKVGKMPTYCSGEWKRDPIRRYLRRERGVKKADIWMGMSCDEMRRVKQPRPKWMRNLHPLIALGLRRNHCVEIVLEMGWPKPPRSSCWMCPNKSRQEWLEMKVERPDDFAKACDFQHRLLVDDPNAWLHPACKPLEEIDFESSNPNACEQSGCDSGMCFV